MTDRRSLVKILAGATLLGVARRASAQKVKSVTIAYLALLPGEDRSFVPNFLHRLDQLGYVDGQNLHFVYRSAEGRAELLPGLASDLISPMYLSQDLARLPPRRARQPETASRLYSWLSAILSAPGSLQVSPGLAATSPDCRT
jgi:hypothetical protein